MIIHVKSYANLRQQIGKEDVDLDLPEGVTVQTALDELLNRYGKEVEKLLFGEYVVILLNDKNVKCQKNLNTSLKQGDKITILPRLSGG